MNSDPSHCCVYAWLAWLTHDGRDGCWKPDGCYGMLFNRFKDHPILIPWVIQFCDQYVINMRSICLMPAKKGVISDLNLTLANSVAQWNCKWREPGKVIGVSWIVALEPVLSIYQIYRNICYWCDWCFVGDRTVKHMATLWRLYDGYDGYV